MGRRAAAWSFGLCVIVGAGCTPIASTIRTVILEPTEYSRRLDDCMDQQRNCVLAKTALAEFAQQRPELICSVDFARGFEAGYADFLFAGGPGNPPPIPPRYYWRPEFENPQGHKAIEDWYAGFRVGAAVARESGYRRLVTIPTPVAALPASVTMHPEATYPETIRPETTRPDKLEEFPKPKPAPVDESPKPKPAPVEELPKPAPPALQPRTPRVTEVALSLAPSAPTRRPLPPRWLFGALRLSDCIDGIEPPSGLKYHVFESAK